jgi:NADH:ubiquinone oxidoreductase subunit 2 (subunit N)
MDFTKLSEAINFLQPEIAVSISLLVVTIFDLIFHHNKKILPYLAIIGIIITGIYAINQLGFSGNVFTIDDAASKNYGMVTVDAFGGFFKILVLISSALIVLFSFASSAVLQS